MAAEILIDNRSGRNIESGRLARMAGSLLRDFDMDAGELGISLVSRREIELLNREHMGRSGPTDVISFPLDVDEADSIGEVPLLLGDVIICPEIAAAEAAAQGHDLEAELCLLVIHGVLHIIGFDHENDAGEMDELQNKYFEELCTDAAH